MNQIDSPRQFRALAELHRGTLHAELKWVKRPSSSRVVCLVYLVSYSRYGYGAQEGAESGDNSKKPGRPSHVYLTYQMEGLWLILGG